MKGLIGCIHVIVMRLLGQDEVIEVVEVEEIVIVYNGGRSFIIRYPPLWLDVLGWNCEFKAVWIAGLAS